MPLRILHTADNHIGISFAQYPDAVRDRLFEERFTALERIVATANDRKAHFLVVAGDLFDKQTVTKKMVERAVQILSRFGGEHALVLAGNYDFYEGGQNKLWKWFRDAGEGTCVLALLEPGTKRFACDDERNKAVTRKAELEAGIRRVQENVEKWRQAYTNLDTLTSLILSKAGELKEAETELAALPQLPEGFENVAAYANVRLDGGTPVEVTGKLTLGMESLSQGTLGSLALATRLALADLYLEDLQGFLVLDDPFADMDPARRRAAAQCLGAFAGKRQVLFFTCHPEHKEELSQLAGAKIPVFRG